MHPLRSVIHDRRSFISFGAGTSAAYVFVHLMPELHGVRQSFVEAAGAVARFEGMAIYFLALVGFLVFYGLDHLRARLRKSPEPGPAGLGYRLHVGGFAAYVWLAGYLLVRNLEDTRASLAFYAAAIAFHFLSVDHSLRHEHGEAYANRGRFVLAAAALLGWGAGLLFALPAYAMALMVAFISGAIIMNSLIMELPSEKDGRFLPFLAGGILYGLVLLPLG